ncbi:hypothetical protein SASPL_120965 [Salvia splendens]|uniref:Uncharacterized protein n=1 Tax=Salvia splendens TaxID=180675 RepID=A0A8X8XV87_SALSN|nr:hypothetical protein SASPL_120965 [Salvia splendens]
MLVRIITVWSLRILNANMESGHTLRRKGMANRSGLKVYEPVGWELKPIGRFMDTTIDLMNKSIVIIYRNCLGEIVAAFCLPLAANSGLEVEMKALLEAWAGRDETHHDRYQNRTKSLTRRITHIRREGNKAADLLASLGNESVEPKRCTGRSAPGHSESLGET